MSTTGEAPVRTGTAASAARRRWAVIAAVAVVVVAAVVAVVVAATRPATVWDRGSPQGVVQAYVTALVDGDTASAAALLAPGSPCGITDLDKAYVPDGVRVDLVRTDVTGNTAMVRVRVSVDTGVAPADNGESRTFRLTRTATGGWLVDGIPWPLYECTGG